MTIPAHLIPPRWPDIEDTASERPFKVRRTHHSSRAVVRAQTRLMREQMNLEQKPILSRH